jgi:carbamoyl-phosphate synthase large subunit
VGDPALYELGRAIVRELGWVGPLELEFAKENGSGRFFLLEVNARFPAWVYLAPAAGQNLPLTAVRLALGEDVSSFAPCRRGVMFFRSADESALSVSGLGAFTTTGTLDLVETRDLVGKSDLAGKQNPAGARDPEGRGQGSGISGLRGTVAVTGLDASSRRESGFAVLRCLRALRAEGLRLLGIAYDPYAATAYRTDMVDEIHLLPHPAAGRGRFLASLVRLREEQGVEVLIPCHEADLPALSCMAISGAAPSGSDTSTTRYGAVLPGAALSGADTAALGISCLIPREETLEGVSRLRQPDLCERLDIPAPRTHIVRTEAEARIQAAALGYPVILKATREAGRFVAHSEEELRTGYPYLKGEEAPQVIVQEYVRGEGFSVTALATPEGRFLGGAVLKKIACSHTGFAWGGVTVSRGDLLEITRSIIENLRWTGPLEVEFIEEEETGRFVLLDLHPRFSPMVSFLPEAGINLPEALVRLALGEEEEAVANRIIDYKKGWTTFRYAEDIVSDMKCFSRFSIEKEIVYHGTAHCGAL